jgi:hypothetical protein
MARAKRPTMEHSPLNKRLSSVRRTLLASMMIIGVVLLCGVLIFKAWLGHQTVGISPTVRPAVEAVLRAQVWSKISGSYWEDEMVSRAQIVSALPKRDRLDFYRVIVLTCELDTSRATLFCQLVAKDAELLRRDLVALKESLKFARLSTTQQKEVVDWIDELKVITEMQGASMPK